MAVEGNSWRNLGASFPIYVTRKDAGGATMSYSMSLWMSLLAQFIIWFNVVGWGVYGIAELIGKF